MKLRKRRLKESRLYAILDKEVLGNRSILRTAGIIIKDKGCGIIQLRDKVSEKEFVLEKAVALRKLLLNSATLFIINDYLDIAKIVDSDGIHLGQGDLSIEIAKKILGKDKIVGISCHSLRQALDAQEKGADYISIGPVFATPTKTEYNPIGLNLIKEVKKKIKIPFFVIGGIGLKNINQALSKGAKNFAICSAICQARNIRKTIKAIRKQLNG